MHHNRFLQLAISRRRSRVVSWALAFLLAALATTAAVPWFDTSLEYKVKAAFLYNFARYTAWPEGALQEPDSPLVFAVVGEDPFGPILDAAIAGKSIHGHPLRVLRFREAKDLKPCQVLFVADSEEKLIGDLLTQLEGEHVLSVSNLPGFTGRGGTARFTIKRGKVGFEINTDAAAREQLVISSQLLKLATLVGDDKDDPESDR